MQIDCEFANGTRRTIATDESWEAGESQVTFEIVFDTLGGSRKAQNLRVNRRVALVLGNSHDGDERTIQYEGLADEPTGAELQRLKGIYFGVFPDGREREKWPGMTYFRVTPVWIRYSNYNVNPPEIVEFETGDLAGDPMP